MDFFLKCFFINADRFFNLLIMVLMRRCWPRIFFLVILCGLAYTRIYRETQRSEVRTDEETDSHRI